MIGLVLILLGASVWPIGLYVLDRPAFPDCLVPHLCLVIPGVVLRRWEFLKRVGRRVTGG
jgi:hypothetical protein